MEAMRELAELAQRGGKLLLGRVENSRGLGVRRRPESDEAKLQRDRDETLLSAVVQVALEPSALGIRCLDDACARSIQLEPARPELSPEPIVLLCDRAASRAARRAAGGSSSSLREAWRRDCGCLVHGSQPRGCALRPHQG